MGARLAPTASPPWGAPTRPSFNLIDELWIPVVSHDGRRREVGLRELLRDSRGIESISADSVLVETAVLRLTVALICHAHQGPRDEDSWRALWNAPSLLDATLNGYLDEQRDAFFLLDPERPFAQSSPARLEQSGAAHEKSLTELTHQRASGTAKRLFDKSRDTEPLRCSPPEAARLLVAYQCWAPGGGRGYGSSRLVGRALVCVPFGKSLHETVLLNTTRYDPAAGEPLAVSGGDPPSWTRDRHQDRVDADRPVDGLIDLLTRRPRAVCLLTDGRGRLGRVMIAAGERIPGQADLRDPNLVYREGTTRPQKLPSGAPVWTELPALLAARAAEFGFHCTVVGWAAQAAPQHPRVNWCAVAVDSNQAAIRNIAHAGFRLPARVADDPARRRAVATLVDAAQTTARLLDRYISDIARRGPLGNRHRDTEAHKAFRKAARDRAGAVFWAAASQAFTEALGTLAQEQVTLDDAARANQSWSKALRAGVEAAIDGVQPLMGASVLALIDSGEARALLARRLPKAIGTPIEVTGSQEGS